MSRGEGGGPPLGNQNGLKLKDPDVRQQAYKEYCDWLARGKSQKSFTFESDELTCTSETLEKYIKDKVEFDPLKKQVAYAKGLAQWEEVAEDCAKGLNKAVTPALQMVMRNKFGWDKPETHQETNKSHVQELNSRLQDEAVEEAKTCDQDIK